MTFRRSQPDAFFDRLLRGFLVVLCVWLLILGVNNVIHQSDWAIGDWLINYSGGFVRRGLIGEGVLLLTRLHLSPLWTLLSLQWFLYAVVLFTVWKLARFVRWSPWLAALVFSPATLAFALLDPSFAFRKEIVFFALLAATLLYLGQDARASEQPVSLGWLAALLTVGCAVCMLAHEALIVFYPYLFAALWLGLRSLRRAALCFAAPALVSVALLSLVSHFAGDAATSEAICRSVGGVLTDPPTGICGGAIQYLGRNSVYAHSEVLRVVRAGGYAMRIPWLILLALLPVAMGIRVLWAGRRFEAQVLLVTGLSAWLLSGSIFYYGTDWTRWISIHTFSLCLLLLWAESRSHDAGESEWYREGRLRVAPVLLLLVYCLGWELTVSNQRLPLGGFLHYVRHNLTNSG